MEYILTAWVLTLAYFIIRLTERVKILPTWIQCLLVRFEWLQRIVFRYRCPYPIDGATSARACFNRGFCGCNNADRFRDPMPASHAEE